MGRLQYYRKRRKSIRFIIGGLSFAFVLTMTSLILLLYPFHSNVKEPYFTGENPILYNGKQKGNALIEGDTVYVPLSFMEENFDETMTFDKKSNSIIITTKDKVVQMPTESLTYYVNEKPVELHLPPLKTRDGKLYLALNSVLDYYPIQFVRLQETGAIWVQKDGEERKLGHITEKDRTKKELRMRIKPSLKSPYTEETVGKEAVFIEKEFEGYYFVRKQNGVGGYLKKEVVMEGPSQKVIVSRENKQPQLPKIEGPINLTWEAVYSKNPDLLTMPEMPGVNVVSPTWFELTSSDGTVKNLGSNEYVKWAKERGYHIWALFSNGFDPQLTHEALKDFETRQTIIRQLLHYSQMYELDGINIDIENVNEEDGPLVTQFMREATPYFHEAGLIVSMDITFIAGGNWSAFYERDKLADIADYLAVMAYDEHWGSSPVAGSVASLPWVEKNLQTLLEVVPHERLVLGVPLYTRLWKETEKPDGTIEVSSEAMSMGKIQEWMSDKNLSKKYDEKSGQNYVEYNNEDEKTTYKIWLEDELSLKKRADLAKKYKLAGVASWARYFADERAWTALRLDDENTVTQKSQ
ncbi:peptidoglycan hydrolase [Bacillus aquiflavi]|uniref:Peptidoglycan hydrolase n=1 Tax=Bacillus aquiflavi TaxID=2672567 RepID=A0A6B3VXP9_9BACI|nr:glycosyl hydrolase family 18 protein [Bacillus aquiflavi]MBA4538516.1 peptidoglycan hydrolase [Bacillus aquiflavi]NEY82879.1 peptidoglycan hydrolase [Bacillus aquiflavi]